MRITHLFLVALLFGFGLACLSGCGSNEAEVAPRTASEIEAYEQQVYAAEEEDDASSMEDEDE